MRFVTTYKSVKVCNEVSKQLVLRLVTGQLLFAMNSVTVL